MTEDHTCHHADAKNGANALSNGPEPQESALPQSLIAAVSELVQALGQNNQLLLEVVTQNAMLIDSLLDHEESDEDDMRVDMAGNPIRVS